MSPQGVYSKRSGGYGIIIYEEYMKEFAMKTTLKIEGMSCDHCVRHVGNALKGLEGVQSAEVDLKNKTAQVEHAEGVSLDALKAAVSEAGYEVLAP
jgi:copper ion binding protein